MPTSAAEPSGRVGRIRRSADYARLQASGRRLHGRVLVMIAARSEQHSPRIGFTVSRKVGNAVTRNRVKRWLREAVRTVPCWPDRVDLVLVARADAARAGFTGIQCDLGELLGRLQPVPERM